ncbi:carbohydrate kinase [Rhizobium sp. NTR19]|uniref:Carbohydrate kinase n=2 Tax=Neorhizobium turbinariae TaxID=2937795 RepID=A0ABT0IU96_9HYPH|nr:carbohydrate kinase [Neorhizobium turbinariae]MCK8781457.1 carbohydrate kinase [Neorhizobium turbinariae]
MSQNASPSIAVFDLGKTNSKLFVIAADGMILAERRTRPVWQDRDGLRVLDDAHLFSWMQAELNDLADGYDVSGIMFSGHGCTFGLIENGALAAPMLDYEQEPPVDVAARIDGLLPSFSETFSPNLPLGLNYGRHILWLKDRDPALLERAETILAYPQFWSWRFSGTAVSEVSYLGCHSHLWAPLKDDYSSLVDAEGWRAKMPPMARAGSAVGTWRTKGGRDLTVHNGVHDSNAALYYYRSVGFSDFTLVSTGTWVIIFNSACPLEALHPERDMLANVTVDHQPTATIRFMGGREYDIASGGWNEPVSLDAVAAVIAKGVFTLPSFAAGGPMPGEGSFVGPAAEGEERAAAALLYVALMTDISLDLIRSENDIVIDGGLVKTGLYPGLLAALRPQQRVLISAVAEGSALGAAALAFDANGISAFTSECRQAEPVVVPGLDAYRKRWISLAESRDSVLVQPVKEARA